MDKNEFLIYHGAHNGIGISSTHKYLSTEVTVNINIQGGMVSPNMHCCQISWGHDPPMLSTQGDYKGPNTLSSIASP
jgi:hypothetical protein